jgi:hypothetical protein
MFVATEVSLLLGLLTQQKKELYVYIVTLKVKHFCMYPPVSISK